MLGQIAGGIAGGLLVLVLIGVLIAAYQDSQRTQREMELRRKKEEEEKVMQKLKELAAPWATIAAMNRRFLSPEYRQEYVKAHYEAILANRKDVEDEFSRFLHEPEPLRLYCTEIEPKIFQVVTARFRLIELAEKEQVAIALKPETRKTPAAHREKELWWSDVQADDELSKIERALEQAIKRQVRLDDFKKELEEKYPDRSDLIDQVFVDFEQSMSPPAAPAPALQQPPPREPVAPEPEIYGFDPFITHPRGTIPSPTYPREAEVVP
jgi:hypothetical protein